MRRHIFIVTVTVACALCAMSTTAQDSQKSQPWKQIAIPPLPTFHPPEPKRIELKNGLVILLMEDHELPFINGFFELRGGSRDVPASKAGMLDLYGDVWRTSGTATKNGDQLDDLLEAKAAKVETNGDADSTSVSWSCLKQDEDQVYGISVDLLEHPSFNEQKLKLAQQQAMAGIVRRNDNASGIASREAAKLVYGKDSPYTREPEIATVTSVTVADLKAWHDKSVIPNNMIVAVSGDFDAAQMEKTLRATFESIPKGAPWPKPENNFAGPKPGVYLVDKNDVNQSNVWIVGLGTQRNNPDYYALSMMNEVFSGGFGSRLFQDIRTKQGLAYSVGGGYGASYDHPGMFRVVAGTKSETTEKALAGMLKDIGELKNTPFTEVELQKAKDEVLNSFIFDYDSKDKVLYARASLEFYGYPPDFLEKYRAGVEKVTTADLERVAKKYIDLSKLAVLVVGNSAEFGTPLSQLGLGEPQKLDVTIPMPPGMGGGPGDPGGKEE